MKKVFLTISAIITILLWGCQAANESTTKGLDLSKIRTHTQTQASAISGSFTLTVPGAGSADLSFVIKPVSDSTVSFSSSIVRSDTALQEALKPDQNVILTKSSQGIFANQDIQVQLSGNNAQVLSYFGQSVINSNAANPQKLGSQNSQPYNPHPYINPDHNYTPEQLQQLKKNDSKYDQLHDQLEECLNAPSYEDCRNKVYGIDDYDHDGIPGSSVNTKQLYEECLKTGMSATDCHNKIW